MKNSSTQHSTSQTSPSDAMPQSIEAEMRLLGLILWHMQPFPEVDALISPAHFYREEHRLIYHAIQSVAKRGDVTDTVAVSEDLEHHGIKEIQGASTFSYLSELQRDEMDALNFAPLPQRAMTYAKMIRETAEKRQLISMVGRIGAIAMNGTHEPVKDALAVLSELQEMQAQAEDTRLVRNVKGKLELRTETLDDVMNYPDPVYLVSKMLEVATVSLLYGESGTGKTFLALAIAFAVAYGRDWLGRPTKQGQVLYFYQEGKIGLKRRVRAWLHYYGVDAISPNIRFVTVPTHLLNDKEYVRNILEGQDSPPVLVIFDTFSNCAAGINQSHQEEVYPVLAVGHDLARDYGTHVMLIHHDNKNGDYNGSKAFRNHVDAMLLVEKGNTGDGSIILSSKKTREEEPWPDIALQLLRVELDEEVSSCVVVTSDAKRDGVTLPQSHIQALEVLYEAGKMASNEWSRRTINAYKVSYPTWNRYRKRLEQEGYVEAPPPEDGKERIYTVTPKGKELLSLLSNHSHDSSESTAATTITTIIPHRDDSSDSSCRRNDVQMFIEQFCSQPDYGLRLSEEGKVVISVPESMSDAEFEEITTQVLAYGEALRTALKAVRV